ncbi:tannase/feruloyl esterase family alpha/beta hydrolase [Amycolatopsis mongoliensis]|uniref:Tannase/feruloyl esterase family alpha/beta hydrolase n=1 Tax=Amycolatopsis mongoliensis TaxID=715475 RepID=A0A9Y2JYE1_9PSEU|nr:tannase/feruloyl esterase family alpha/beta hydrolase [Amycolatopsis sp. 4-36]WIY06458.1 tannase/feruloyl esterase family alpha/beta hydrolase [Amycolatopsis sp. 4-36]
MRRIPQFLAAAVPLLLTGLVPLAPSAAAATPACAAVSVPAPAGAKIESVTAEHETAYCRLTVTLTHSGTDHVKVAVALPDTGWTGRLQALGGSAYAAGNFDGLAQAVKDGYTAVTTDAGVSLNGLDTSWAVTADGTVDRTLLTNFATRAVHEEALIGKAVTQRYYHRPVVYSYWTGCSTGGRQGYSEAQKYPGDFDGILADAPAVDWTQFAVATLWPQIVMNQSHDFPSTCVLSAFRAAAVHACDARDGVTNGIVDRPDECGYDPRSLVGTKVVCDGHEFTVTAADAEVMRKIWAGPTDERGRRLWAGLPKGADYTWLAGTKAGDDGTLFAPGFPVAVHWVQSFLEKQPGFDTSKLTYGQFADLFRQSVREYDDVIGTSDPDLSAFRRAGGKLITFVGANDQLIPPGGTLSYRKQVERTMGGAQRVNDFYRLFLAPGVEHCFGGGGPEPTNALGQLVDWVEHGKAPATLAAASADGKTRNLCPLPSVSRYTGGDPATASSYRCR